MNPLLAQCERALETQREEERGKEEERKGGVYKSSLLWLIHLGREDMVNEIHYHDILSSRVFCSVSIRKRLDHSKWLIMLGVIKIFTFSDTN